MTNSSTINLQRFLETQEFDVLDKALDFEQTPSFRNYLCCLGAAMCACTYGFSICFVPIATFAGGSLSDRYSLRLDKDNLRANKAYNDCCCHIATTSATVPLDKIQDVQLKETCCLTCFKLKQIDVQTAGQAGPEGRPEISVAFLKQPEQVREAIQLAVKLSKQNALQAPLQAMAMGRSSQATTSSSAAAAAGGFGGNAMLSRLQRFNGLVSQGWLSQQEGEYYKVALLGAESDAVVRLADAAQLVQLQHITHEEFAKIKGVILPNLVQ